MNGRPQLLLVESDPEVLHVVPSFLARVGDTSSVQSPEQALEVIPTTVPDILLISSKFLEPHGERILRVLRDRRPFAQVMVLSERRALDLPASLLAEGIGDILVKPFDVAELPARLQKLLQVIEEQERRDRLARAQDARLQHKDRMILLGTLVATVAHEVASPLSVIVTNTVLLSEILKDGGPCSAEDREILESATQDTLASSFVIKDYLTRILRFSRQEKKAECATDLADTMKTALLFVKTRARDKNLQVHVDSVEILPVAHRAGALAQAIVNALSNAIDAAKADVWLRVEDSPSCVTIIVEDDGEGLTPEQHRCLCDPFFTTKDTGTGLGTVVMRQVMVEHGGDVQWRNLEKGGVEVRLTLPRRKHVDP